MISNIEQCYAIQQSRVQQKKYGYAKSVRRFLAKQYGGVDTPEFNEALNKLPVSRVKPQKEKAKDLGSITINIYSELPENI